MSPTLDTVLTVVLFAVGGLAVIVVGVAGFIGSGIEIGPAPIDPTKRDRAALRALEVLPPLVLFGPYLAALLLAVLSPGPTFYYPLIAVPLGLAAWTGVRRSLSARVRGMRAGRTIRGPRRASRDRRR